MASVMDGFRHLNRSQRIHFLKDNCGLSDEDCDYLLGDKLMSHDVAERMIENVVGYFPIPLGIASHFVIDGVERFIPMAVEETSIIAAASSTAKWIQRSGEMKTSIEGNLIIGQIQFPSVRNPIRCSEILIENIPSLIEAGNRGLEGLVRRGGGIRNIEIRKFDRQDEAGTMMVLHLLCDPCDAMGANLINQTCESLKPMVEAMTGEKVGLCILSNLVDTKLASAEVLIRDVPSEISHGIEEATQFAKSDPYRAATHNKGILNGIDSVLVATGNDWRAVEAGAHAYASRSGKYQPLTEWKAVGFDLHGKITLPMSVGTVGGMTALHPIAKAALKILNVRGSEDLSRVCAAVGLVQNLGALKALSTVGIVRGHMQLHAANLAMAAGADGEEIEVVARDLASEVKAGLVINRGRAKEILEAYRNVRSIRKN